MKFEAGQKIFFVHKRGGTLSRTVEVVKVGRKYAQLSHPPGARVHMETRQVEDSSAYVCGHVYESEEHWSKIVERFKAWHDLRQFAQAWWRPPAHLTGAQIIKILKVLKNETIAD